MKLYYSKGACSLAVRIVINELGLKCDYEAVDLSKKQVESGHDFLQINAKGSVPTLQIDNKQILTENSVIQQYLADSAEAHELLPPVGEFNRYRVLEWLNYITTELHKGCSPLFNASIPHDIKEKIFIPLLKSKLTFVDKHLEHKKFLVLEHFTLPDAYLFVILTWLGYFKINLSEWPHIATYFDALLKRKSIMTSLEEEGLRLMTT